MGGGGGSGLGFRLLEHRPGSERVKGSIKGGLGVCGLRFTLEVAGGLGFREFRAFNISGLTDLRLSDRRA